MTKCVICERRPASENGRCAPCDNHIKAERKAKANSNPQHFLTYRGIVVGLFSNGNGTLIPRLLRRNPDKLPKSKTLDLNHWCEGFDRHMIKRFKATCLQLAGLGQ